MNNEHPPGKGPDQNPGNVLGRVGGKLKSAADLLARVRSNPASAPAPVRPAVTGRSNLSDPLTLMQAITNLAGEYLPSGKMSPEDDFFTSGGSSVKAVGLAARLASELGVELSLDDLFADARPRRIAERWLIKQGVDLALLAGLRTAADSHGGNAANNAANNAAAAPPSAPIMRSGSLAALDADLRAVQLEDMQQIQQDLKLADDLPWLDAPALQVPKRILLTGATGFLGSHVLFDLLRHSDAHVVCVVRAANDQAAARRLEVELEKRDFIWSSELLRRITVLTGDLQLPRLGWSDARWQEEAHQVDSIVNVAAAVDFVRGYHSLREMNVLGAMTLANFAADGRVKPLHHVSSLAIFDELGIPAIGEEEPPARIERLFCGYDKTKWVTEALLRRARERGFCVTFLRPGGISGNSQNGVYNPLDLSSGLIAAFQSMRLLPEFKYMNLAPVDWISRIIAEIVIDPPSWGYNFHLIGEPVALRQQVRELALSGMATKVIGFEPWRLTFLERMERDPIPNLDFLALALRNRSAVKLLEAIMAWPAATAHRVDALIARCNLPARPKNDGLSQVQTVERLVRDGRAKLPARENLPYLWFRETMEGSLQATGSDDAPHTTRFQFDLSVASFYQLFRERRVDVHGEVHCAALHAAPLQVESGSFWVRPNEGVPQRHGMTHPLIKYQLVLRTADGQSWWLQGFKYARPGFDQITQALTMQVSIGPTGEPARYHGIMVVPAATYIEEQIKGIKVNPNVPEQEQYAAKAIWMGWFGLQLTRGLMQPLLRVGAGILDILRTGKDKGE